MSLFVPELHVRLRYANAARQIQPSLCCPVSYNEQFLRVIPKEVLQKDYGCGDPSRYLKEGETVLDLGSGAGKICFIAAQIVGKSGRVIGVDMTDEMLEVARRNAPVVAERLGYANVEFKKGRIQDLALDPTLLDAELKKTPVNSEASFVEAEKLIETLRQNSPLIPSGSIDVVVSNCVLNLVESVAKKRLFSEIHRVLRPGGRAVISDIVSAREVPPELQRDPELWSGCISGALTEEEFVRSFESAGFHGTTIVKWESAPWRTVEGIDFRSVTVEAFKHRDESTDGSQQSAVYLGPFSEVTTEQGERFVRGRRTPVSPKTAGLFRTRPYQETFALVDSTGTSPSPNSNGCCAPATCC